jgi:hypothetical protein
MEINKDLIRWVLLIGASPIWLPFLRHLWRDFNHALRDEGGLIGAPPRGQTAERLRAEKRFDRDRLTSEPILGPKDRVTRRMKTPAPGPRAKTAPGRETRARGFRDSRPRGRGPAR